MASGFQPDRADERREPWLRSAILLTAAAYLVVAFAGVDTAGGKGLGPRLLLPLFPLLAVSAIVAIGAYLGSAAAADRWVGRAGLVLAGMAVTIHLFGAIPAYYYRNQDDSRMIRSVVDSRERLIVVDDPFTAQMLLPLYYRRLVLLADSAELRGKLGARLAAERQTSLILVTRARDTPSDLAPFRNRRSELRGRMTIQYWGR